MKRKILIILLTFIGVVCLSLFAVACGDKDGNGGNGSDKEAHTHSYSEYISPTHATCSEAGLKGHYCCTVCGEYFDIYKRPVSVDELATEIDPDAHNFEGGSNCTICNVASNYTRGLTYFETFYRKNYRLYYGYEVGFVTEKSETEIVIPCAYKGKPVISIRERVFYNCTNLTSITIPDSVIFIDNSAFYGCTSLEQISVDENNKSYSSQDGILYNKDKTEIIEVPIGIKGSITIPDSVTSIGSCAFYNCTSLESIIIPDNVTSIGSYAFYQCTSLTSVTIPDSVTSIGDWAFSGCTRLEKVYYAGTPEKWNELYISNSGGNDKLLNAKRYYYSAEMPNDENWQNDYWWHYDSATGQPVVWTKEN